MHFLYLSRIKDTRFDHINKNLIVSIEALANRELFNFVNDHSALKACVGYDME